MADAYELPAYDFAHLRENMIKVTKDPEVRRKEVLTKRRANFPEVNTRRERDPQMRTL